ncbi:MAG: FHA domain-containing protein, partial [Acidimicrobiales bacterium]
MTRDGRHWDFGADATVGIGRAPDNDIVVADPTVSRHHARLRFDAGGWVLEAMGSRPTFVNGEPVTITPLTGPAEVRLVGPEGPQLLLAPAAGAPAGTGDRAGARSTTRHGRSVGRPTAGPDPAPAPGAPRALP